MIEKTDTRVRCRDCGWSGLSRDRLVGPNPFNYEDRILGCPECNQCTEGFDTLCSVIGCHELGGNGFPTKTNGYLFTCYAHYEIYKGT